MQAMQSFGVLIHVVVVTCKAECLFVKSNVAHLFLKLEGTGILSWKGS